MKVQTWEEVNTLESETDTVPMATPGRDTEYPESAVIDVFQERDDHAEPLTASEVAEELGCSRRTALNKLHALSDRTDLTSKKVGGRSRVWWIPVLAE